MKNKWVWLAIGAAVGYAVLGTNGAANAANIPLVGSLATSIYNLGGSLAGNNTAASGGSTSTSSGSGGS